MKKLLLAIATVSLFCIQFTQAIAQGSTDPVVLEVGGQQIRQSEFMHDFNATVGQQLSNKHNVTYAEKRAALDEYVELYSIFRAKLLDAHARGFDTTAALRDELARYRKELAAPYLLDSAVLRQLMAEAYERNHYSLHAAHILVATPINASLEDSAKAYEKALDLYHRIVDNGEDFFAVASDYFSSRNPGVQVRPNEGDLGYFSVFEMVYPFENAAYALEVGEVSKPVRTRYGFHIIKLLDKVEGLYGKVTMAHIWLHSRDSATRRNEIFQIYNQLNEGSTFEQLAHQSDDRTTSDKGGVLADAGLSQLPPEYIHKLVGMKEGEYSKPFFTQYGWHIIKLLKRDSLPSPENLEGFYKQRLVRDMRGEESRKTFAADSRKKYGIVDYTNVPVPQPKKAKGKKNAPVKMMANLDELYRIVPDSVYMGKWKFNASEFTDTTTLAVTPSKRYTSLDAAQYINKHQKKGLIQNKQVYVNNRYNDFIDSISIDYADSQLEIEHADFAEIVDEYRRGLMIFNYNDALIWRKAIEDTTGFSTFFARESRTKRLDNPDDSIYFFHPRARVTIIDVANETALPSAKAKKIIAKAQKKNVSSSEMKLLLQNKIDHKKFPDENMVQVDIDLVEQTRQTLLKDDQWQRGVYVQEKGAGYRLIAVDEILPRTLKGQMEARGYYLNAWQNEVERQLNEELREKYNVKIHYDIVHSISY